MKLHFNTNIYKWVVLDMPKTALWTLSFYKRENAVKAYNLINKKFN